MTLYGLAWHVALFIKRGESLFRVVGPAFFLSFLFFSFVLHLFFSILLHQSHASDPTIWGDFGGTWLEEATFEGCPVTVRGRVRMQFGSRIWGLRLEMLLCKLLIPLWV